MRICKHLDRQALSERSSRQGRQVRRAMQSKQARQGRQVSTPSRRRKHDTLGARCAEPSEARLRAANQEMVCFIFVRASKASDGKGKPQNASFLLRCVTRCFVQTPLARFPSLLIQVFVVVVKPI